MIWKPFTSVVIAKHVERDQTMTNVLDRWFKKYFSDPEGVILAFLLVGGFAVVVLMGEMLAPLLASAVVAYLLEGVVRFLEERGVARLPAVLLVFSVFLAFLVLLVFGLMPLLSSQISQLLQEKVPVMIERGQAGLLQLPHKYPNFISEEQVKNIMNEMAVTVGSLGQAAVSLSLASISSVFALVVYLVLVPVLVFFMMKDKAKIVGWVTGYLPRERGLATRVWHEMDMQIGNYVRGKFSEIIIVGVVSYIVFAIMKLQYAMLLGALVGLSVVIPYIGAAAVTLPVGLIAYFQWGWSSDFAWLMVAYGIIQALDGNVLVPLLFSEVVNLHPVAIITAVLVFGGFWGFWGVFFAIPLATLVKAVISAWPRSLDETRNEREETASAE
jgi:putative permease